MRPNMSKMHFFFCPCFLEVFRKVHFLRCRFVTSRKHYKNRGFRDVRRKSIKNEIFPRRLCVLRRSARFRHANKLFLAAPCAWPYSPCNFKIVPRPWRPSADRSPPTCRTTLTRGLASPQPASEIPTCTLGALGTPRRHSVLPTLRLWLQSIIKGIIKKLFDSRSERNHGASDAKGSELFGKKTASNSENQRASQTFAGKTSAKGGMLLCFWEHQTTMSA